MNAGRRWRGARGAEKKAAAGRRRRIKRVGVRCQWQNGIAFMGEKSGSGDLPLWRRLCVRLLGGGGRTVGVLRAARLRAAHPGKRALAPRFGIVENGKIITPADWRCVVSRGQ